MLFRRRSRSRDSNEIKLTSDGSSQPSPKKAANTKAPKTLEEIIGHSTNSPKAAATHHRTGSSDGSHGSYDSSSDQSQEFRKAPPPKRVPTSRKTGFATIITDSTDSQPAFESDAFAVLMPTTRLPILDHSTTRAKRASPAARAAAYKAYQEKARQVRERNNSEGVKVPSKILSYDYTSRHETSHQIIESSTPGSQPSPAGSFPHSPPLPQKAFDRHERIARTQIREHRPAIELSKPATPPKVIPTNHGMTSSTSCYRVYRMDSTAGASGANSPPSQLPASITVRIKPKTVAKEQERIQTESRDSLYNRPSHTPCAPSSCSSDPVKSMPNFTRQNSTEGDSIFGYRTKDTLGTVAGASPTAPNSEKEKGKGKEKAQEKKEEKTRLPEKKEEKAKALETPKDTTPKRTLTSRWPWLRPSGPRIPKPTTTPVVFSHPVPSTKPPPSKTEGYIDPFVKHAAPVPAPTPLSLRTAAAPRKVLTKPTVPKPVISTPAIETGQFDTGFAQIKKFTMLLVKGFLIIYAIIALWYILDAVREAFHTIGAPFRALRWAGGWVWVALVWLWGVGVRGWERWGVNVKVRGGWMWRMRW